MKFWTKKHVGEDGGGRCTD